MDKFYRKQDDGWYVCGCGYDCLVPNEAHVSKIIVGYCHRGMRISADDKYQCICGKTFDSTAGAISHAQKGYCMRDAEDKKFFTCNICDLFCYTKSLLKKHEKTKRHINKIEKPLYCKTCDITCTSKNGLEEHLKTKKHLARLEAPPLDLECKLCNIKCASQKQMKTHLQTKKHLKQTNVT